MPTEIGVPVALFLFAHQDDEFGVFSQIEHDLSIGRRVVCIYATDGAATANPARRESESLAVLKQLGVSSEDVFFVGRMLTIGDGQLHKHVTIFSRWLQRFLVCHPTICTCYVPAWEGGHPDHDLTHAIATLLIYESRVNATLLQYPLYNGRECVGPFFRLLSPMIENGDTYRYPIYWRNRLRYVRLCLSYPSQWRSWLGLFPFAFFHYLFIGVQQFQQVDLSRLLQPPHSRPLYYERRKFLDWPTVLESIQQVKLTSKDHK